MSDLPKPVRVLIGIGAMALFIGIAFAIVVRYAGAWGVPYFSFTSDRGSHCKNTLTGYVCTPLTLADVEYWAEIDLPQSAVVKDGKYTATHDYQLTASLVVPAADAEVTMKALHESFGKCGSHAAPLDTAGLKAVCVMANDDAVTESEQASSRLWAVGTGTTGEGNLIVGISIKSR
jgi:hypothetical protein